MPSDRKLRALIDGLLAKHEPAVRKAFLEAIQDARSAIVLQDVVDALARGDLAAAMAALDFSRAFLAPLDQAIAAAYYESGRGYTALLMGDRPRGVTLVVRFDPGAPRAAQWLREHSSALITEVIEDQRTAVREALSAGMDAGRNPRTVALDVVGRVNKASKRREGGVIGLTSQQAKYVENARAQLASGDPAEMQAYFERRKRDKRFDSIVRKAIREGKPVSAVDVTRIATRYSEKLLAHRGEMIARTESLTALSYGQDESVRQLLDSTGFRPDQVEKTWRSRADGRTRDTHVSLSGKTVSLDGTFVSPSGARMRFPRDSAFGAPASELVACRCYTTTAVNWSGART